MFAASRDDFKSKSLQSMCVPDGFFWRILCELEYLNMTTGQILLSKALSDGREVQGSMNKIESPVLVDVVNLGLAHLVEPYSTGERQLAHDRLIFCFHSSPVSVPVKVL
jgi:hypothetical protein